MNKDDQLYVQFGDFIELHVEHLGGNVASQGFSNRNCYLQLIPPNHRECFTRNKRDFMFQVWPKLNFDARKDYESGLEIFNKNFSEKIADDDMGGDDAEAAEKKPEEEEAGDAGVQGEGENPEGNMSMSSFFGSKKPKNQRSMNAGMKQDRENFIKKLKGLERKLKEEEATNQKSFRMRLGEFVEYGNEIQLLHVDSGCFIEGTRFCADEDNSCNKVELAVTGSKNVVFKALGGFKYKLEGDRIHYNDQIVLYHNETKLSLHVTEKLLKIEGLEGLPESIKPGVDIITPKKADRRDPPNHYVPQCEVNLSGSKSKFQIVIYRYYDEDLDQQFIKGGSVVRLLHSERGGFMHSDDKDFTDDGLAEVYLWNFKGKATDLESQSSSSLFELEIAQPLKTPEEEASKDAQADPQQQGASQRIGRVFTYSIQGQKAASQGGGQNEEVQYRLRHLNTGRLVIDQEILYNGINMRTLGLSPHLTAKNLAQLSDKQFDGAQEEIKLLDNPTNYEMEAIEDGTPKNYEELDLRSRFRIISTSPSVDPRIKAHSCVQIQHVASEMYLSYETKTTFAGSTAGQHRNEAGQVDDAEMIEQLIAGEATNVGISKPTTIPGDDEHLFWPVDDDDIQSGTRDAIELKPARSNEDAFFILPETQGVLQSILFIQTAIDLLKKYLPTICSRNLEISKEKQTKIFDLMARILDFLLGDTQVSEIVEGEVDIGSGFSKDENDMQMKKAENYKLRQKLMRELYTVEALVHIIYLPFAGGDFSLDQVQGKDLIAKVCRKAYNLIKLMGIGYYQNELYVSQWINLYFNHAMSTSEANNIGAEDTIITLVDNNMKLLQIQITPAIIEKFVDLCKVQNRNRRLIQLLKAICSCDGHPVVNNQNDIARIMLEDDQSRTFLMMPVRAKNDCTVDVLTDSVEDGTWKPLTAYRTFSREVFGYFLALLDLTAELCLGRNHRTLKTLQEMYSFDTVTTVVKQVALPMELRALFMRILLHMHMDREPLEPIQIPSQTGVWNELPPFIKEKYNNIASLDYPIKQSKISVPPSLASIKKFVEIYLYETQGVQNIFEVGKNMMTFEILKIIQFMLRHGFYGSLHDLRQVAAPMVNLLNGANDIYYNIEDKNVSDNIDDFVSVKRYFCSGNNDIIVQCKSLICINLLIVSELENDGKAQVFLSKQKSDLDMELLQQQMSTKKPGDKGKNDAGAMNDLLPVEEKVGFFAKLFGKKKQGPQVTTAAQAHNQNIEFLEKIAGSYNFEADNQDAYICVLFDLLLYKYPGLAKGIFELLVRLFTRKRTLLETLMQIQMLENPKSIWVLSKVKKYSAELRALIEDADQWLNKTNQQSRKAKYRVAQIFKFFSQVCQETGNKKKDGEQVDPLEAAMIPAKSTAPVESRAEPTEPEGELGANKGGDVDEQKTTTAAQMASISKVSREDFLLFDQVDLPQNKENQRLMSNFGIENLAMFFIKYRVDRNSVNDPFYQQLIYQCYSFLVMFVKDNIQNQIKVHDNLEVFLRDIDKNPLICLLIYVMFKDNKKFLTLNVSKILRLIILSAEEAPLASSKKALYLKLLEVFCKFEDKLVRPNQQEIVINFTRDTSKNNLISLFSTEGLPYLISLVNKCLPPPPAKNLLGQPVAKKLEQIPMSIEVFNVMVCLKLMSMCCEGKSDLAEIKCQNDIVNLKTALKLYEASGRLWPFKCSILKYVCHCYLDSGNGQLFLQSTSPGNVSALKQIVELVAADMASVHDEWNNTADDCVIQLPNGATTSFLQESKVFALDEVCHFFKQFLKNRKIELGVDMFPVYHDIIARIAKMYYETDNEDFKSNAMDILAFVNTSEKYARLLENVQHPANQNIYLESKRLAAAQKKQKRNSTQGQKSSQLSAKLMQLAYSKDMLNRKEREFEQLVLWVTNIDNRINHIMKNQAKDGDSVFNEVSFKNVSYNPIVTSFMTLLDSKCLSKDLHITGLTLIRKIVEVENHELVTPAADWSGDEWVQYEKIVFYQQTRLVEVGCIEFLCKHLQDVDDDEILEQTFLVCITLLLGGNQKSQDAFFLYFQTQDPQNLIMIKLKRLLLEQYDLTKKSIGEKNAKLAMVYKVNIRLQMRAEEEAKKAAQKKKEVEAGLNKPDGMDGEAKVGAGGGLIELEAAPQNDSEEDENLLTMDQSNGEEGGEGAGGAPVDEMFLVTQTKNQSIIRCMRLLRFIQLLTEGHHTDLQNFLREQTSAAGHVNQKTFDFVSYVSQMLSNFEKQFINCHTCDLGQQLIDTLVEVIQGPCKMNQKRLVEAKIIDCCRDLIQQGQQSMSELKMRGFTTDQKLEYHDNLKASSIKLLLSIIEGPVDAQIYRQIADSLDDFQILTKRMQTIYERFVDGLKENDPTLSKIPNITYVEVHQALRKDSFKDQIIEGFDIFCLIRQLSIALPDVREMLKERQNLGTDASAAFKDIYMFFSEHTGNVEVVKDDEIMTIYFPIQPVTGFLTGTTQNLFLRTVNRESNQHKINDLIARTPEFIDEMEHLEERSHDPIQITPERLGFFRDFSTIIAVGVGAIVVGFYKYDRLETADGSSDYMSTIDEFPNSFILYLGYGQLVTSTTLLVGFCLNRINIVVRSGWRSKTKENQSLMANDIKFILTPLQPRFGELKAKELPLQAARTLLQTEGPYNDAFIDGGKRNFAYSAVTFEYSWISLAFLMQDGDFLQIIIYLSLSFQGLFQSPIFYSFHLLDVIPRFPQLQNVIQSVTLNGNQLLMTAMLGTIIIYIYSAVGFVFVFDTFYDDNVQCGLLNRKGDSICMSMMHCFLSTVNYGIRGGGGIGEFLPTQTAAPENIQGFYFRSIYDLTFFLIIITILLNIIFGIIIDSFAQLRGQKMDMLEDQKNKCFICNFERQTFDRDTEEGFEFHVAQDHDVWQYLNFIIHLKHIPTTDLNGTESYIYDLYLRSDISWFPMQRSQRLDMALQKRAAAKAASAHAEDGAESAAESDPKMAIPNTLTRIEERCREVQQKF